MVFDPLKQGGSNLNQRCTIKYDKLCGAHGFICKREEEKILSGDPSQTCSACRIFLCQGNNRKRGHAQSQHCC